MKTISYIILTLGSLLGILGLVKSSPAATINAASCSQAEVQAAIDAARDGDTVTVPAGVCSWGIATLNIPDGKNIILQGAGKDVTTINGTYNYTLLELNATSSRITGFTFTEGTIDVHGQGFRIDHCKLTSAAIGGIAAAMVTAVSWSNDVTCYGLIDHCETHNARLVHAGGPSLFANYRWAEPNNLGDQNALYVEDCTVDGSVMTINSTDQNYGGAIVFRYNSIDNSQNQVHSLQAGDTRGSKRWEFYGNTYTAEVDSQYHWVAQFIRGGTGVSFNNKWSGSYNDGNILLDNVRSENVEWSKDDCGRCDGSSLWDGKTPVQDYATLDVIGLGAHKGSNNAPILTDSSKSWIVNDFVGCWIYNLADGSKGKITTNTATTVNATLSGGSRNNWNSNDNYKLSCGYPCRDAIGQGQDEFLWVTPNVPPIPAQSKQPAYIWGNWNGATSVYAYNRGDTNLVKYHFFQNQDFYNYTASFDGTSGVGCGTLPSRPSSCTAGVAYWATNQSCSNITGMVGPNPPNPISGTLYKCTSTNAWTAYYTPYTYPHPLQRNSDTTPPAAPTGLSVN